MSQNAYIKSLQVLAAALIAGQLIFAAIVVALQLVINKDMPPPLTGMNDVLLGASAAVTVLAGLAAFLVYRKGMDSAKNLTGPLNEKLDLYRSTLIKYLALSELGGMLSVICLFLTGDMRLLGVTTVSIALMVRGFTTRKKLVNELQLNWQEEQDL